MNFGNKAVMAAGVRMMASVMNELPTIDRMVLMRQVSSADGRAADFWADNDDEEALLAIRIDWTKLFRGLSPDDGPRPPYEFVYAPQGDEVADLLDMKRIYGSAGLSLAEDARNRPDYLGFELEFAARLVERGGEEGEARMTFEDFAHEHLRWVPEFCDEALPFAKTGFFVWYLNALKAFAEEVSGEEG